MTYTAQAPSGPAGRSYTNPYDVRDVERPAGMGKTIGTLIALVVALMGLMIAYTPVTAAVLILIGGTVIAMRSYRRHRAQRGGRFA